MLITLAANPVLTIAFAGLLGLLVGSFLNVVILRLPARMAWEWRSEAHAVLEAAFAEPAPASFANGRSACPSCGHAIRWFENLPVASWLVLRGRCSACRSPISRQYPLVELLTGLAFAAVVWHFSATPAAIAGLILTAVLVAASGIDVRHQLLPDVLLLPLLWLGLLLSTAGLFVRPEQSIVGATLGYLSLWSVFWVFKLLTGKEGLGYGDFKLLAVTGAWFGPQALLPVVFGAAVASSAVGLAYLWLTRQGRETTLPFGPYLAGATWLYLIVGAGHVQPWLLRHGLG